MKTFILALQFLTRFYIPIQVDFSDKDLRHSLSFFPWVGLLMGYLLAIPFRVISRQEVAALLVLVLWIAFAEGVHLDDLSDMADGFFSSKEEDKILEIMKDSRVGVLGAISLILILLSKCVLLSQASLTFYSLPGVLAGTRFTNSLIIGTFPPARPDGMGRILQETRPLPYTLVSGILLLVYLFFMGRKLLLVLLVQVLVVGITPLVSLEKIDGATRGNYGTNVELAKAFGLLVLGLV